MVVDDHVKPEKKSSSRVVANCDFCILVIFRGANQGASMGTVQFPGEMRI